MTGARVILYLPARVMKMISILKLKKAAVRGGGGVGESTRVFIQVNILKQH